MSQVKKAVLFSVLTQHSTQIISMISIAIVARLLTPAEIGVFAVASSLTFLATELRALGAGQYLIREKQIDTQKIRAASGLMIVISWSLCAAIVFSAPLIANFYGEATLSILLWIIAPTFLLAPFSSIPSAILSRNLKRNKDSQ